MEVLLAGNTGYLTAEFVRSAFPSCRAAVLGSGRVVSDRAAGVIALPEGPGSPPLAELFEGYGFERAIWFSARLTPGGGPAGELEALSDFLAACPAETQVLYLDGPSMCGASLARDVGAEACAELCRGARVPVRRVVLPWLYDASAPGDLLGRAFAAQAAGEAFCWPAEPESRVCFLAMDDLAGLLRRLWEDWPADGAPLVVPDDLGLTMEQLARAVQALRPGSPEPRFAAQHLAPPPREDGALRRRWGWAPRYSILDDLPAQRELWQAAHAPAAPRRRAALDWMRAHAGAVRLLELVLGCLCAEWLTRVSGAQMQFRLLDFRLLFLVLMGTVYGMPWGLAAAGLESLCLAAAYAQENVSWLTLFYEPGNWTVFIANFTAGAVCGYARDKSRDELDFARRENAALRQKLRGLRRLYREAVRRDGEMKHQILTSRGGFGRACRAARTLDADTSRTLYLRSVQVLEETLEIDSAALYSVAPGGAEAYLEAASRPALGGLAPVLRLEALGGALPVLDEGEVWVNRGLAPGLPMLAAVLREQGAPVLLAVVQRAEPEQLCLDFEDRFRAVCGLMQTALLRVRERERLLRGERCVPGAGALLQAGAFRAALDEARALEQAGQAHSVLLRMEPGGRTPQQAARMLAGLLPGNALLGRMEDGCLGALLPNPAPGAVAAARHRLQEAGFPTRGGEELSCT